MAAAGDGLQHGAPSSLTIRLYALYISTGTDCSNPVLVQDLGSAGVDRDFMTNPVLFTGEPAAGSVPLDDRVTIFMTRNPEAAMARGISSNQIVALQSSLIVPGQSTFYLDASQAVTSDGQSCELNPPVPSFR
jgi:hypothetical protein